MEKDRTTCTYNYDQCDIRPMRTLKCNICKLYSNQDTKSMQTPTESGEALEEIKDFKSIKEVREIIKNREVEGKKFDNGKPKWSLLPLDVIEEVVKVYTYGATKYNEVSLKDANWKKVEPKSRYEDAHGRHIANRQRGNVFDEESGFYHYAHAIFNLLCLLWHDIKEQEQQK